MKRTITTVHSYKKNLIVLTRRKPNDLPRNSVKLKRKSLRAELKQSRDNLRRLRNA